MVNIYVCIQPVYEGINLGSLKASILIKMFLYITELITHFVFIFLGCDVSPPPPKIEYVIETSAIKFSADHYRIRECIVRHDRKDKNFVHLSI